MIRAGFDDRTDATGGRIRRKKVWRAAVWTSTAVTPSWRTWRRGYFTLVTLCPTKQPARLLSGHNIGVTTATTTSAVRVRGFQCGSGCTDLLQPPDDDDSVEEDRQYQQRPMVCVSRQDTEDREEGRFSPYDEPRRVLGATHSQKYRIPRQSPRHETVTSSSGTSRPRAG